MSYKIRLAKNSLLNLLGFALPLLIGIIAIPLIIKGFGIERFGFLTIAWALVGYFNLFDLGLSRALTYSLAAQIGSGLHEFRSELIWTSLISAFIFGIIGAFILIGLSPLLVSKLLNVPTHMQEEFKLSLYILSAAIPMAIVSTGLKGLLEAYQAFTYTNLIQIFIGISNFVSPLLALPFSYKLTYVVAALLLIRFAALVMYTVACLRVVPDIASFRPFNFSCFTSQIAYGGWITVSTVVGPVMMYFDRFIIGSLISLSAVAYYTTPYEIVTKVTIISAALSGALFPALSASLPRDRMVSTGMFESSLRYVFMIVFPIILIVSVFAEDALRLWLGGEFAVKSAPVLQWLAAGVFMNCLAFMPFAFIQASNRPDVTAKIHLLELPFYLVALIFMVKSYGIVGAAAAWSIRAGIDGILLFIMTYRLAPETMGISIKAAVITVISIVIFIAGGMLTEGQISWYYTGAVLASFIALSWRSILTEGERGFIRETILRCP